MKGVWGVVVAAGAGHRFGSPKHSQLIGGSPLWELARSALAAGGTEEVVVVGPVPGGVPGGPRRRDSVSAGLARVPGEVEYVLVHDAARPLASPGLVDRVIERLLKGDAEGVIPALPVTDALKETDGEWVRSGVERKHLVAVQTPQGFVAAALRRAHAEIADEVPDDAELLTRSGAKVVVVEGEPANIKVTHPEDLIVAEALFQQGSAS